MYLCSLRAEAFEPLLTRIQSIILFVMLQLTNLGMDSTMEVQICAFKHRCFCTPRWGFSRRRRREYLSGAECPPGSLMMNLISSSCYCREPSGLSSPSSIRLIIEAGFRQSISLPMPTNHDPAPSAPPPPPPPPPPRRSPNPHLSQQSQNQRQPRR